MLSVTRYSLLCMSMMSWLLSTGGLCFNVHQQENNAYAIHHEMSCCNSLLLCDENQKDELPDAHTTTTCCKKEPTIVFKNIFSLENVFKSLTLNANEYAWHYYSYQLLIDNELPYSINSSPPFKKNILSISQQLRV